MRKRNNAFCTEILGKDFHLIFAVIQNNIFIFFAFQILSFIRIEVLFLKFNITNIVVSTKNLSSLQEMMIQIDHCAICKLSFNSYQYFCLHSLPAFCPCIYSIGIMDTIAGGQWSGLFGANEASVIAYAAYVGGFVAGLFLIKKMLPRVKSRPLKWR